MIGLALSRNLCRLGESLRPSASAWAGSRVGSSFHERILTPPPLAGLQVCRLNLRPSSVNCSLERMSWSGEMTSGSVLRFGCGSWSGRSPTVLCCPPLVMGGGSCHRVAAYTAPIHYVSDCPQDATVTGLNSCSVRRPWPYSPVWVRSCRGTWLLSVKRIGQIEHA